MVVGCAEKGTKIAASRWGLRVREFVPEAIRRSRRSRQGDPSSICSSMQEDCIDVSVGFYSQ